jgi:hypothetical protein
MLFNAYEIVIHVCYTAKKISSILFGFLKISLDGRGYEACKERKIVDRVGFEQLLSFHSCPFR